MFGGGSLTNEKAYLLGKFARVALGTSNIDYNGRFCMSSGAAAATMAFGLDRGLPFPLEDIPQATTILLAGANIAETMPPLMQYFEAQRSRGGTVIVVDPRRTPTAAWADRHLAIRPGTDAALANGLLHVLIRDDLIDAAYIRDRTDGFEQVRQIAAVYWPENVEQLTGVPAAAVVEMAHQLGTAPHPMILTARGPEQQSQGVSNTLAYINIALALGAVGKPFSGYGCLTGQGNGQGGREHGQKADQLPGYRRIDDDVARAHMADVWGMPASAIPGVGKSAYELLTSIGRGGGVRSLLVMGSNIAVSAPNASSRARAPEGARISRRRGLLSLGDGRARRRRAAVHAVGGGRRHADEPRGTRAAAAKVARTARAACAPTSTSSARSASASGIAVSFSYANSEAVFDELRRASHGGPADYFGHHVRARRNTSRACSGRVRRSVTPARERLFSDSFPTPNGRARFHAVSHRSIGEETTRGVPVVSHDRPRARAVPVGNADAPRARAQRHRLRSRSSRCIRPRHASSASLPAIASCSRPGAARRRSS